MQTALQFLEAVLPANGLRVVAYKPPRWTKGLKHTFLATNDEVVQESRRLDDAGVTTYLALATYNSPEAGRTADNTVELQCLWMDVDAKHFDSLQAVMGDIAKMSKAIGAPSIIVSSGGGAHAYWVLRRPLPTAQWKPLADAFQATWQGLEIKADPISADAARILRLPTTHNHKYEHTPEVRIAHWQDITYDPDSLAKKLRAAAPVPRIPAHVAPMPGGLNDDLTAGVEHRPSYVPEMVSRCRQLKYAYAHQDTLAEPVWYRVLQVLRHAEEGRRAAHLFSNKHPGYSERETDERLDRLEAEDVGPTTCQYFRQINPAGCEGCEYKITSPIQLGYRDVKAEPVVVEQKATTTDDTGETVIQQVAAPLNLNFPHGYTYSANAIYKKVKDADTGLDRDEVIFNGLIFPERMVTNAENGWASELQLYVQIHTHPPFHITIPGKATSDKRSFAGELHHRGISFMPQNASHLLNMVNRMVDDMLARQNRTLIAEQMGWQEDAKSFVIGTTTYRPRAEPQFDTPVPATTRAVAKFYEPAGSLQGWKDTAAIYNKPGGEPWQFALCYGAAGALLPMTSLSGMVLSLYSQESGRGKSTAGEAALSWWGNPAGLMSQSKDTLNAVFNKSSTHKNLPMVLDEITDKPTWELEDLVYHMVSGREKARLSSGSTAMPLRPAWALPVITTSNNSVKTKLLGARGDAQGLFARIMEVPMDLPFATSMGHTDSMALRTGFKQNYGHAGPLLVRYIMENRDTCATILDAMTAKLAAAVGSAPELRYWIASCACALAITKIANTIGLLSYDMEALTTWTISTVRAQEHDVASAIPDGPDVLSQFLEQNAGRVLVVFSRPIGNGVLEPAYYPEDGIRGNQLIGRVERDAGRLYISLAAFMRFCTDNGFDLGAFIHNTSRAVDPDTIPLLLSAAPVRVNLGRGTKTASARSKVLEFDLHHSSLLEFTQGIDRKLDEVAPLRRVS